MNSELKLVFCVIFLTVILAVKGDSEKEGMEMMMKIGEECREAEHATKEDVQEMFEEKLPTSDAGKCLNACMMEKLKIIDGAKFSPEHLIEIVKLGFKDDEVKIKQTKEIVETCRAVVHSDRCNLSYLIMKCMKDEAEKRGIKARK